MTTPPIPALSFQPVFILGPHRSGTSALYRALVETGAFNCVTTYHIVHRQHLLDWHVNGREAEARAALAARLAALGLTNRQFDAFPVGPDVPEEYGHALPHQGRRPRLSRRNFPGFLHFCSTLQMLQEPDRPLLLKNPFDSDRFLMITRALPHARFIFVHRNPVDVASSQVRAIRAILADRHEYEALLVEWYRQVWQRRWLLAVARAMYGSRSRLLVYQVRRNLVRLCRYVVNNVDRVNDRVVHVRYADFCARPDVVIDSVLQFCQVTARAQPALSDLVQPRTSECHPDVRRCEAAINRQTARYRQRFGV
ncbi:MAG TPA: sulfotransferase [Vicinamibacterales bacterium]